MNRRRTPEGLSVKETAVLLDVHHTTVRRWIRRGWIKAYRVGPTLVRIPRSEVVRMRVLRLPHHKYGDTPEYIPV